MDYLHYIAVEKIQQEKTLELLTELTHRLLKIETELKQIKHKLVRK